MNVKQLLDLTGNVAIVTGGYTAVGKQMVEEPAEAGANPVITARNLDGCIKAGGEITKGQELKPLP